MCLCMAGGCARDFEGPTLDGQWGVERNLRGLEESRVGRVFERGSVCGVERSLVESDEARRLLPH